MDEGLIMNASCLPTAPYLWLSVRMVIVILGLIVMVSVTVAIWRKGEYGLTCEWFCASEAVQQFCIIIHSNVTCRATYRWSGRKSVWTLVCVVNTDRFVWNHKNFSASELHSDVKCSIDHMVALLLLLDPNQKLITCFLPNFLKTEKWFLRFSVNKPTDEQSRKLHLNVWKVKNVERHLHVCLLSSAARQKKQQQNGNRQWSLIRNRTTVNGQPAVSVCTATTTESSDVPLKPQLLWRLLLALYSEHQTREHNKLFSPVCFKSTVCKNNGLKQFALCSCFPVNEPIFATHSYHSCPLSEIW